MAKIVVIDDERSFNDGREAVYLRTCTEALRYLEMGEPIAELWFDHDLGKPDEDGHDTVRPVVDFLLERAYFDEPYPIGRVLVHTANSATGTVERIMDLARYYRCDKVDAVDNSLVKP